MRKRKWGYFVVFFCFFFLTLWKLYSLNILQHDWFSTQKSAKTEIYFEGESAPRGRILDVNGEVLVDNVLVEHIMYRKINHPTFEEEVEIARRLGSCLDVSQANEEQLKQFYLKEYPEKVHSLILDEEWKRYEERKLTDEEITSLEMERITDEDLQVYTSWDRKVIHLYFLMNQGYSYQNKKLVSKADASLVANVVEQNIPGVFIEQGFERTYPYGEVLQSIFGNLQEGIPKENQEDYLKAGYALSDTVGISFFEKQYDSYLQGEKALYSVLDDGRMQEIRPAKRGNDLYLTIDIHLEEKLVDVMKETMIQVKKMANTEYFHESYALIGDPKTGGIRAMVGLQQIMNGQKPSFQEVTSKVLYASFTPGSVVKGASHTVGYMKGAISVGEKVLDRCIKLYLTPQKCSYKKLGYVDDITALKWSSNSYQFLTAIRVLGLSYSYDMKLNVEKETFDFYRSVFQSYGLGSQTGIDLPNEQVGMAGEIVSDDLFLNYTIGQYDTYTPLQLLQYIQTIETEGVRYALCLLDRVVSFEGEVLFSRSPKVLSTISLDSMYYQRIKEGMREVLFGGTGNGYVPVNTDAYGKTGTSESFYDSDLDGVVDVSTITSTLAMIAHINQETYSLAVVAPHISHFGGNRDYTAPFARYISNEMVRYLKESSS